MNTFPLHGKKKKFEHPDLNDAEDDNSLEFFITKRPSVERKRDVKVTDAEPGPNFLEILIFAASVCLWITSGIFMGCHVVMLIWAPKSYGFMLSQPSTLPFLILHIIGTVVEVCAAILSSLCCGYDVEAHNVITIAKAAIGFVSCNIGILTTVLVLGAHEGHAPNGLPKHDPSCSGSCGHGLDVIAHLFVGCSYEGIGINLCAIPVLVWVLKESILFYKADLEARREKFVRGSHSTVDIHQRSLDRHSNSPKKVKFSSSRTSFIESILPEVKDSKKHPHTRQNSRTDEAREAVLRILSEDWNSLKDESEQKSKKPAVDRAKSSFSSENTKQRTAGSSSTVDPWSTTSPSSSDDAKDF